MNVYWDGVCDFLSVIEMQSVLLNDVCFLRLDVVCCVVM